MSYLQELWYAQRSLKYDVTALLRCLESSKVLCKREFDGMRLEVRRNARWIAHEPAEQATSEEASGTFGVFQSYELELQRLREKARLRESGVAELVQVPHVDPRGPAVPDGVVVTHAPEATRSSTDGPRHVDSGGPDGAGVPDCVEMSFADKLRGSLLKLPADVQVTHAAEAAKSSTEEPKRVSSKVTAGVEAAHAPEATKSSADDPKRSTPRPLRSDRSPPPKDGARNQPEGDHCGGERQNTKNLTMHDGVKQLLDIMWLRDGSRQCTCAVAGGKLFALQNPQPGQGPLRAQVFDPSTGKWPSVGRFNTQRMNAAAAAAGTHLYLVGGQGVVEKSVLKTAVRLDVHNLNANGRWEELPCKMSARRQSAAAASFGDGRVLVCGGSSQREEVRESAPVLDSVEVLRLSARQLEWQPWPPMLGPRARHAAATVGQSILTCGGGTADCEALATCELCDPETQTWSRLQPMCIAREAPLAIPIAGELFVFSRRAREVDEPKVDAERFDPEGRVWEALPLDQIGI